MIPSGQWSGFYLESHRVRKGWMHLYLAFESGVIKGEGTDYVGPWTLQGSYELSSDDSTAECRWIKSYVGRHDVSYEGKYGSDGIKGKWDIRDFHRGDFHIWPSTHTELNELYMRQELEMETPPSQLLGTVENDPFLI